MAAIKIPASQRQLNEPREIRDFLAPHGITYERWEVEGRLSREASAEDVLAAFAPEIEQLKARGGYVTADVIDVTSDTPGLQAMLDRFNQEHTHSEDEVRFIVRGRGLFHLHPPGAEVFALEVEAGDLINVPAGTPHWFDLCGDRDIRAIRLFREKAGWTPAYTGSSLAEQFAPVCFGPSYLAARARLESYALT